MAHPCVFFEQKVLTAIFQRLKQRMQLSAHKRLYDRGLVMISDEGMMESERKWRLACSHGLNL